MAQQYCSECGAEIDATMNFCESCGAPIQKVPSPEPLPSLKDPTLSKRVGTSGPSSIALPKKVIIGIIVVVIIAIMAILWLFCVLSG